MEPLRQPNHERIRIADQADVGALRRTLAGYAARLCGGPGQSGRAELVATELATNLLLHAAPDGWILARPLPPAAIELIAVDRGPGIADLAAAVEGRSPTPKGLGCGLAAVRRVSSRFDIHTEPDVGTTVLAVVELGGGPGSRPRSPHRSWAGVSIGLREASGDGWAVAELSHGIAVAVVDGLGHGVPASAAADAALDAFAADPADLDGLLARANETMRDTRGGAFAACRLEPTWGEMHYVAVGNISGRILAGGEEHGLISQYGTLGLRAVPPRVKVRSHPWPAGATLVLWTDGLTTRIDLPAGDLFTHDPAVAAATLHRDHTRHRDDATIVVAHNRDGT